MIGGLSTRGVDTAGGGSRAPADRTVLEIVERIFEASGTPRTLEAGEMLIEQVAHPCF
jgi:hypothetical protein